MAKFSYSVTRDNMFRECPRGYYLYYYGADKGWSGSASEEAKKAYRYKKAKPMGLAFKEALTNSLRGYISGDVGDIKKALCKELHDACYKALHMELWKQSPNSNPTFTELVNGNGTFKSDVAKEAVEKIKEEMKGIIHFSKLRTVADIMDGAQIEDDGKDFESGILLYTMEDGTDVEVWAKPSFIIRKGDKVIAVLWSLDLDDSQLKSQLFHARLVAQYICDAYDVNPSNAVVRKEDMITGEYMDMTFAHPLEEVSAQLDSRINEMRNYIKGHDTETNIPIEKESFKMAEDKGKCHSCQFFNICYKGEEDNGKQ